MCLTVETVQSPPNTHLSPTHNQFPTQTTNSQTIKIKLKTNFSMFWLRLQSHTVHNSRCYMQQLAAEQGTYDGYLLSCPPSPSLMDARVLDDCMLERETAFCDPKKSLLQKEPLVFTIALKGSSVDEGTGWSLRGHWVHALFPLGCLKHVWDRDVCVRMCVCKVYGLCVDFPL